MNLVYYFKTKGDDSTYKKIQGRGCHTYVVSFCTGLLFILIKCVSRLQ